MSKCMNSSNLCSLGIFGKIYTERPHLMRILCSKKTLQNSFDADFQILKLLISPNFVRIFESSCKVNPHILRTCYMYVSKNTRGAKIWRLYIFWHTLRNIQWHEIKVSFCRQNYFYLFDYTMMYIVHEYLSLCWTWEFRQ